MCASTFSTAFISINGPMPPSARSRRRPPLRGRLGEPLGKSVIDAVLRQNAVGAGAGIAGTPAFQSQLSLLSVSLRWSRDRRHVAGAVPTDFLKAREKAASDWKPTISATWAK